jgi:glycerol kinase
MRETTALGAAIAAGFAVNVWQEFDELKNINREGRKTFTPSTTEDQRSGLFSLWEKAVKKAQGWVDNDALDAADDEEDER